LKISQSAGEIRYAQWIGRWSHRFFPAKHINRSFWKKLIDVEKIRPAEHVKRHRDGLQRFWKIRFLPCVQFLKLPYIQLLKLFFKKSGVRLPLRVARKRRKRIAFRP